MENEPLVSVIMALYKIDKTYVEECINSLLNQTYNNIEILCMDDCSPDFDYAYLQEKSQKIRYYRNEVNIGLNKTINKAFTLVKGEYVVRLDSDDWFEKDLIEKEVNFLEEHKDYGAVCCELKRFGNHTQHIKRPLRWDYSDIVTNKIYAGTGYAGGMMFRKKLLETCKIDESLKICEDFDFHLQLLYHMPIGSIHEILYHYRSHNASLCSRTSRQERWASLDKIMEKHRKLLQK